MIFFLNTKALLLAVTMLALGSTVCAQQVLKVDTSNTARVRIFNSDQYFSPVSDQYKHAIKINPLLIAFGDIPVYYEHRISTKLSLEGSLGLTMRNYMAALTDDDMLREKDQNLSTFGYSTRIALRFYPSSSDDAIIGYYFAPEIMYRKYNNTVNEFDNGISTTTVDLKKTQMDYKLIFGYQDYFDNNILIDYYLGVGVRKIYEEKGSYDYNSSLNNLEIEKVSGYVPAATLGVKLGFGF